MQATARRLSVVSATSCARRRLIRDVRRFLTSPVNEDQTIFTKAVRAAESLPLAVREQAAAVQSCERRIFDASYLEFLREQIALGARGPEWTGILTQRLPALLSYCDAPTLSGTISTQAGDYHIRVDPSSGQVIHHELYEPAGNA